MSAIILEEHPLRFSSSPASPLSQKLSQPSRSVLCQRPAPERRAPCWTEPCLFKSTGKTRALCRCVRLAKGSLERGCVFLLAFQCPQIYSGLTETAENSRTNNITTTASRHSTLTSNQIFDGPAYTPSSLFSTAHIPTTFDTAIVRPHLFEHIPLRNLRNVRALLAFAVFFSVSFSPPQLSSARRYCFTLFSAAV